MTMNTAGNIRMFSADYFWGSMHRFLACSLFMFFSISIFAQTDIDGFVLSDSLRIDAKSSSEIVRSVNVETVSRHTFSVNESLTDADYVRNPISLEASGVRFSSFALPQEILLVPSYCIDRSPMYRGDYSAGGALFGNSRFCYAAGSQTTLPGLGVLNKASFGYTTGLTSRLSLSLSANMQKIGLISASGQAFGFSGALTYQASERIGINLFGSNYAGSAFGLMSKSYGASMKLNATDVFSLEMGVRRCYNPLAGRWETIPMVVPSFKFGKQELGIDVGGLLYEILNTAVTKRRANGNPTIMPSFAQ